MEKYDFDLDNDKDALLNICKNMYLSRCFNNACNQQYMKVNIRGFMHIDNGQESIPAFLAHAINVRDNKYSYYREHCHALACGVDPGAIMAKLCMKETGTCKGAGGSMHIFDKEKMFRVSRH